MARLNSPEELESFRQEILSKRDPNTPCISICAGAGCIDMQGVFGSLLDNISCQKLSSSTGEFNRAIIFPYS